MFCLDKRNIRVAISPFCNSDCVYCDGQQKRRELGVPGAMEDFRRKSLDQGVISTDVLLKIIKALHLAGFEGMTLTGGEPLMNTDWAVIVDKSRELGISRIGVTTNGMLLNSYLKKNKHMPKGLASLTISLDTVDADRFKAITRRDKFKEVMEGLRAAKKDNPKLKIRANKVLLKSDLKFLPDYIRFCEKSGVIDEINLLNLILKNPKSKKFFEKEFISAQEVIYFLSKREGVYNFVIDSKYEFDTKLASGLRIILKDTNLTMRNGQCDRCAIYCQEGFYTVRVATDGTIMTCPDYRAALPYIDGPLELKKGELVNKVKKMVQMLTETEQQYTLDEFFRKNKVELHR